MSASTIRTASPAARRPGASLYRWVRQLHLWIGAWGALAAVLYGSTGLIMNHRFGDGAWPQGDSGTLGATRLAVPATARSSAEALSLWLREAHGLDAQVIRKPKPDEGKPGERGQAERRAGERSSGERRSAEPAPDQRMRPPHWTLSGGTASESWSLEYAPGASDAELKRTGHSTLAALNRLHKAVGGGIGWRILGDSFAISMILLGLSGLWLWARGRTPKQMLISVLTVSALAMAVVLVPNLL